MAGVPGDTARVSGVVVHKLSRVSRKQLGKAGWSSFMVTISLKEQKAR